MKNTTNKKPTRDEALVSNDLYTEQEPFTETGLVTSTDMDTDWTYTPEGDLEISEGLQNWFKEKGLVFRWVRHTKSDFLDSKNLHKNKKKGYEFVKLSNIPAMYRDKFEGARKIDGLEDYVTCDDLVLMAAPIWKRDIVKKALDTKAHNQISAVNRMLQGKTQEEFGNVDSDVLKLINESKSVVKTGGSREVNYADRSKK